MSDIPFELPLRDWHGWTLDPEFYCLHAPKPHEDYYVDLERCLSPAQVLDWICQINGKKWGTVKTVAGLVNALHDVLNPQVELCSWGQDLRLTKDQVQDFVRRRDWEDRVR